MEIGGFVRFTSLTRNQRYHMTIQESGSFVIWSMRTRAETTDPIDIHVPERYRDDGENAEEEAPTDDEHVHASPANGATALLLENMRLDQNVALRGQRWSEASQIQNAIIILLDATAGDQHLKDSQ